MARRLRAMVVQGKDIANLLLGEPDFPVPSVIVEAVLRHLRNNPRAPYPPVSGLVSLREAIVQDIGRRWKLSYSPDQVLVSTGSKQSIFNVLYALIEPGEKVLIPVPYWVSYVPMVQMVGGVPVLLPTRGEEGFRVLPDQLQAYLELHRPKVFLFCSPSNPTGVSYTRQALEELACVLERYPGTWIISDEIYELILYEGVHTSLAQIPSLHERTIITNGFSKSLAMPGWRVGYAVGAKEVIGAAEKVQGQVTSGANVVAQYAAQVALQEGLEKLVAPMREVFRQRRDWIYDYLKAHLSLLRPYKPQGAFYYFLDFRACLGEEVADTAALAEYFLAHGVAMVAGEAFGMPGYLRLSYATGQEEIEKGLARIREIVEERTQVS
ncbi:MAG: pyridoxal phosphate-dependent aminotransferase [Bacteroidia bacterium]